MNLAGGVRLGAAWTGSAGLARQGADGRGPTRQDWQDSESRVSVRHGIAGETGRHVPDAVNTHTKEQYD